MATNAAQLAKTGKFGDLRRRLVFLLLAMVVYRVGAHIPVPGIDPGQLQSLFKGQQGGILSLFNMFSGGALSRFTVFALGIMPYISASIIMQLLTYVMPQFEQLKKEGEAGRRKITQYTRYGTLGLCLFQSLGIAVALEGSAGPGDRARLRLPHDRGGQPDGRLDVPDVAGRADHRAGPGQRHLAADLRRHRGRPAERDRRPAGAGAHRCHEHPGARFSSSRWWCVVTYVVVFVERGQRKILVNYARRQVGNKVYGGQSSHLPLKLNMSGVIPPIFASSIILLPATVVSWFSTGDSMRWLKDIAATLSPGQPIYVMLYAGAIVFFCFFYTALVFNSRETADNLKKSGAFVPGIRPGDQTARYIDKILLRLTLAGAVYITIVCLLPEFLILKYNVPFYFGGTSLLIIVVVTMDFMAQVQNYMMSQQYESLLKKANFKTSLGG